jgi:hypothetical protein
VNRSVYIHDKVNYDYSSILNQVTVDATGSGTMTVVQDSGNLTSWELMIIGCNGKGTYVQRGA